MSKRNYTLASIAITATLFMAGACARVLDADGTQMKPYQASRIIEQELDMHLSSVYEKGNEHNIQEESNHG